jgi:hypothetical protein
MPNQSLVPTAHHTGECGFPGPRRGGGTAAVLGTREAHVPDLGGDLGVRSFDPARLAELVALRACKT